MTLIFDKRLQFFWNARRKTHIAKRCVVFINFQLNSSTRTKKVRESFNQLLLIILNENANACITLHLHVSHASRSTLLIKD